MCERSCVPIARKDALTAIAGALTLAATARPVLADRRADPGFGPALPNMIELASDVFVARIAPRVWVHTTFASNGVAANGMIVERERDAVLVDTGWEPQQTKALLAWSASHDKPVAAALVTHFHADRIGGISTLVAALIPVSANPLTLGLALEHGYAEPSPLVGVDAAPQRFADIGEAFFPGAGHTRDNLTLALGDRIVFGGCLIRSIAATSLGNIDDAVLADYDASVRALQARYRSAAVVVPGHGKMGGDPIGHTLNLIAASGHGA